VTEAVNPGGAVVVYGTMIDEERHEAKEALLTSLHMLTETPNGFDYTPSQGGLSDRATGLFLSPKQQGGF